MINIINYGSGNIRAIGNIYDKLKVPYFIADSQEDIRTADKLILPGVGSFDETMLKLETSGLIDVLNDKVLIDKVPVLGICVGMQIMAKKSEEGVKNGLGWIDGEVRKFDKTIFTIKPAIPHLGWNSIHITNHNSLFEGVDEEDGFYFIHSYYMRCNNSNDEAATAFYGHIFTCSVIKDNIYGVQFHPEKSHSNGVKLLSNFAKI